MPVKTAIKEKILSDLGRPYFHEKGFVLYQGDCLDVLDKIPGNSIDMIFADPPYNLSNGGFTVHAGKRVSVNKGDWDKSEGFERDLEFHKAWINSCRRVLKPEGTIWISGTYHSIYQCGYALQQAGFKTLNDISWFKPNAAPNLSGRYFTASHETLIWAIKDPGAKHTFNYQKMKNWAENYTKTAECECPKCKTKCTTEIEILHEKGKQMRSVWAINTPKKDEKKFGKHPTQKSLELLERIVIAGTNEGNIILDPFTGSSTTGIASYQNKRKFIGIDMEKEYLDLSIKRFEDLV